MSRGDVAARVASRSPRIQFVDEAAVSATVEVTSPRPGNVIVEVVFATAGVEQPPRRFVARSCAEAADAVALIIAVTLDPTLKRKSRPAPPEPIPPAADLRRRSRDHPCSAPAEKPDQPAAKRPEPPVIVEAPPRPAAPAPRETTLRCLRGGTDDLRSRSARHAGPRARRDGRARSGRRVGARSLRRRDARLAIGPVLSRRRGLVHARCRHRRRLSAAPAAGRCSPPVRARRRSSGGWPPPAPTPITAASAARPFGDRWRRRDRHLRDDRRAVRPPRHRRDAASRRRTSSAARPSTAPAAITTSASLGVGLRWP